jgi:nitroreductase
MTDARELFESRADTWTAAIFTRRAKRAYDNRPADAAAIASLTKMAEEFRPFSDARMVVLPESPEDMFTGIVGSYGRITGAASAMIFLGSGEAVGRDNHVGYVSEALMLEATALGLATVWVGGGIDRKRALALTGLGDDERVFGASPLGTPVAETGAFGRPKRHVDTLDRRKSLAVIAPDMNAAWPAWARRAVEHAQWAPSAVNRQPWRFAFEDGGLVVRVAGPEFAPHITRRLDAGIAMLHAELGARTEDVLGTWTDLEGADIARFDPLGR